MIEILLLTLLSIVLLIFAVGIEISPVLVIGFIVYKVIQLIVEHDRL